MVFRSFPSPAAALTLLLLVVFVIVNADDESSSTGNTNSEYRNVYGDALQPCSSDGMALTGYTRSGYCTDQNDDTGSHHICIDLSSLGGSSNNDNNDNNDNNNNQNFCDVTGQSDWCSSEDMPCHEDPDTSACPVTNWCVCQWAFASYIEGSGGCDNIQTVVCESINQQALWAYQKMSSKWNADEKYTTALNCLVDRCDLDASHLGMGSFVLSSSVFRSRATGEIAALFGVAAALVGAAYYYHYVHSKKTIRLNEGDGMIGGNADDNHVSKNAAGSKYLL